MQGLSPTAVGIVIVMGSGLRQVSDRTDLTVLLPFYMRFAVGDRSVRRNAVRYFMKWPVLQNPFDGEDSHGWNSVSRKG